MRRCLPLLLWLALLIPAWAQDARLKVEGEMIQIPFILWTEQPDLALNFIDNLHKSPVPEDLDLEICLLGAESARQAALPLRFREFLKRCHELKSQGSAAQSVGFLLETYAFEELRRRDPEQARRELPARFDRAYAWLETYRPDSQERQRWIGIHRTLGLSHGIWLEALLARADEDPSAQTRIQKVLRCGRQVARGWAEHLEVHVGLAEALLASSERLSPQDPLAPGLSALPDLEEIESYIRAHAPPAQTEMGIRVVVGGARVRQQLQEVRRICRALGARTFSEADSNRVRPLLKQAVEGVKHRANLALANDLYLTSLLAFFHSSKPGWQAAADTVLVKLPDSIEKSRPALIRALTYRARLRSLQGRQAESVPDLVRAVTLIEALIQETGGTQGAAEQIRRDAADTYELLTQLQLQAGQSREAFQTVSRYQQLESASLFQARDLVKNRQQADSLEAAQQRLTSLENQSTGDTQLRAQVQAEYRALQAANKSMDRLALNPVDLNALQRNLPEKTVLVQLFPGERQLFVFALSRQAMSVETVAISGQEVGTLVRQLRTHIIRPSGDPAQFSWSSPEGKQLEADLSALYKVCLAPVEKMLPEGNVVAIAPSGTLLYVPWAALRDGQGRFLAQRNPLVLVTRTRELERILGGAGPLPSATLLALGNPDGTLPAATREVNSLKSIFPQAQVYLGEQATRQTLLGGSSGVIHLATHGVVNTREPGESFLVLGGKDSLRVREIPSLQLAPPGQELSLITLSACQTALGESQPGAQLRSLAEAFSMAGGRSVLASLWSIPDESTQELMTRFYNELAAGQPKALALQQAQRGLLEKPATAHPLFWAAFVLFGDFR